MMSTLLRSKRYVKQLLTCLVNVCLTYFQPADLRASRGVAAITGEAETLDWQRDVEEASHHQGERSKGLR